MSALKVLRSISPLFPFFEQDTDFKVLKVVDKFNSPIWPLRAEFEKSIGDILVQIIGKGFQKRLKCNFILFW